MDFQPFSPHEGTNQTIAVGAAASVDINATDRQVRVCNSGAAKGYFRVYSSSTAATQNATAADVCVLPGMATTVTKGDGENRISTFSAAGTTFEVMTGSGF